MKIEKLHDLVEIAKQGGPKSVAVVAAEDHEVLAAVREAQDQGITKGQLVGNKSAIEKIASENKINISDMTVINEETPVAAAKTAVKMVREGGAQVLMKGLVDTAVYLRAILNKETGLMKGKLLSHNALFEIPEYHKKLLLITDAAINVAPTIQDKVTITTEAVAVMRAIGIEEPKVAVIGAVEKVDPKNMPATVDAAILATMSRRNQIKNCIIDGPFGTDNAISEESAKIKKVTGPVAGNADILVMPDIEAGNIAYKLLMAFAKTKLAAVVSGATAPIVLTSRADSHETKFLSLALALAAAK